MLFIVIAAIFGVLRYRFMDYWKWVIAAAVWTVIGNLLLPGGAPWRTQGATAT